MTKKLRLPHLPPRALVAHKGDFGRILLVAGSTSMPGAALLATLGALRGGAGLVTLATPREVVSSLVGHAPSAMYRGMAATPRGTIGRSALPDLLELAGRSDAAAIGPGLSCDPETVAVVRQFVGDTGIPLVLDADGLNAFVGATQKIADRKAPSVLTPHPGEFARLSEGGRGGANQALRLETSDAKRITAAEAMAVRLSSIVLLKGHRTVVTDGKRTFINTTGNPGMATGGCGDVLAGLIAALLKLLPPLEAAAFGAHVHGLAGDLAMRRTKGRSILATDLLDDLPRAIALASPRRAGRR